MENFQEKEEVSKVEEIKNLINHFMTEDEFRNQFGKAKEMLKDEVLSKPLAAVGIAVAVGFVLGAILKR